jgi:hypothetical protein
MQDRSIDQIVTDDAVDGVFLKMLKDHGVDCLLP